MFGSVTQIRISENGRISFGIDQFKAGKPAQRSAARCLNSVAWTPTTTAGKGVSRD